MTDELLPMPRDWHRALAIVAHPDDLEYGAAGAIAAWTDAGHQVSYLLVTRGEAGIDDTPPVEAAPLREEEQLASAAEVGVTAVEFLDHRDGTIEEGLALRRDLAASIRRYQPELIVTLNHRDTWGFGGWNSADHRTVGRAVLDAKADAGNRWIFPELIEQDLQPWNGVRWVAIAGSAYPTHAVDVSATLERAVKSLSAHRAYLSALSDEPPEQQARSFIEWATRVHSPQFGDRPCVAFELTG